MACKCCYRLFIFALIAGLTICTVLSIVMPLYTNTFSNGDGSKTVITASFATIKNETTSATGTVTTTRTHTRDLACRRARSFYIAAFALIVVSVVVGCLNAFCALVWIMTPCGFPVGAIVFVFTLCAFACALVPFVLLACVASTALCADGVAAALATSSTSTFRVREGCVLLLVSFAGLFITFALQILGCACGCQLEKSTKADAHETTVENFDRASTFASPRRYQSSEMSTYSFKK